MSHNTLPQAIAVVGPTASGKSDIAIALAKMFDGEIVSCDSRQIYRGMDKGTGKVIRDTSYQVTRLPGYQEKGAEFFSEKIRHHMIDIVSPHTPYNVAKFQKKANTVIQNILHRGKLPILCGGTGLWAQAVVENMTFPTVAPDTELRNQLRNTPTDALFLKLQEINPERAQTIDAKNRHRLIRAIEIEQKTDNRERIIENGDSTSNTTSNFQLPNSSSFPVPHPLSPVPCLIEWLVLAISPPREVLFQKIEKRLDTRFAEGMIAEVKHLHTQKRVPWTRLDSFGLEYRFLSQYLRKKISFETMRQKLLTDIRHYAKRQLTWLRRWEKMGRTIHWVSSVSEAKQLTQNFLKK